jgi:voltage-gated potassium channel Kch
MALLINLYRLVTAVWYGIRTDPEFRALLVTAVSLLIGSILFYTQAEGWSIVDSLYFSVMTMSTIGYGDLVPTSPESKLFTILFAILSIGIFVAIVSKIVAIVLEKKKRQRYKKKKRKSEK